MSDETEYLTIGQLARRAGGPARTIRFWSDTGVVQPARRTAGGYRLYDAESPARLDLVRSLRELSRLSAQERQQLIDEFVDRAFAGTDPGEGAAGIAHSMRQLPAELPGDPDQEQVDAWIELAELVGDEAFQQRARQMALAGGGAGQPGPGPGYASVMELAGNALSEGITPGSAAGKGVLDRIAGADTAPAQRASMLEQLEIFTDAGVERYWQLVGIINGRPPFPSAVPAFEWVIAALRAHARPDIR